MSTIEMITQGSFVWTHLRHLTTSCSTVRLMTPELVGSEPGPLRKQELFFERAISRE